VGDSLKDYGVDEVGGRCHDLLGTRCDPYGMTSKPLRKSGGRDIIADENSE
jgi:uncharacterized protein YcgI (DUF1989 family)